MTIHMEEDLEGYGEWQLDSVVHGFAFYCVQRESRHIYIQNNLKTLR